jgi:hypothetical protein
MHTMIRASGNRNLNRMPEKHLRLL